MLRSITVSETAGQQSAGRGHLVPTDNEGRLETDSVLGRVPSTPPIPSTLIGSNDPIVSLLLTTQRVSYPYYPWIQDLSYILY